MYHVSNLLNLLEKHFIPGMNKLPYSVEISDQEDGESRFQEIPSAEVLIKLKIYG